MELPKLKEAALRAVTQKVTTGPHHGGYYFAATAGNVNANAFIGSLRMKVWDSHLHQLSHETLVDFMRAMVGEGPK